MSDNDLSNMAEELIASLQRAAGDETPELAQASFDSNTLKDDRSLRRPKAVKSPTAAAPQGGALSPIERLELLDARIASMETNCSRSHSQSGRSLICACAKLRSCSRITAPT